MDLNFDPPASKTTAEQIAAQLRIAILNGKLVGGEQLRQDKLAKAFQVSRIPLREALSHLQAEGLIEIIPNRGAIVTHLSLQEVEEIYAMRRALEPLALGRAIPHMTAEDFREAEIILEQIDNEDNFARWGELNWAFHESLYRPSGMRILLKTVEGLHNNVVRYLQVTPLGNLGYLAKSQEQHRQLLDLCRRKEIHDACVLLENHLTGPVEFLRKQQTDL